MNQFVLALLFVIKPCFTDNQRVFAGYETKQQGPHCCCFLSSRFFGGWIFSRLLVRILVSATYCNSSLITECNQGGSFRGILSCFSRMKTFF